MDISKDTKCTLVFGNQRAIVSPFGAALRRYTVNTARGAWEVIWGYEGASNKKGGQGDVLAPFPGRIKNGSYAFEGERHELLKNDKDGPNAIHGFLRSEIFKIEVRSESAIEFRYDLLKGDYESRGYPFSLSVKISYSLSESGLRTAYSITNVGSSNAPVGIGFHPYFRLDDDDLNSWSVQIPAKKFIEFEKLVPTGRVLSVDETNLDFQTSRAIGSTEYNACLANLERDADGYAHAYIKSDDKSSAIHLKMDKSFDYIVVYTGDQVPAPYARQGFAIEPMTCAPDAFNHKGWGTRVLPPNDEFSGSYFICPQFLGADQVAR